MIRLRKISVFVVLARLNLPFFSRLIVIAIVRVNQLDQIVARFRIVKVYKKEHMFQYAHNLDENLLGFE